MTTRRPSALSRAMAARAPGRMLRASVASAKLSTSGFSSVRMPIVPEQQAMVDFLQPAAVDQLHHIGQHRARSRTGSAAAATAPAEARNAAGTACRSRGASPSGPCRRWRDRSCAPFEDGGDQHHGRRACRHRPRQAGRPARPCGWRGRAGARRDQASGRACADARPRRAGATGPSAAIIRQPFLRSCSTDRHSSTALAALALPKANRLAPE